MDGGVGVIPVSQTKINDDDGDCWAACVASIFEIDPARVVDIHSPAARQRHWWFTVLDWLKPANLGMIRLPHGADVPSGYTVLSVDSTLFPDATHAVVCLDGDVIFDPNPDAGERDNADYMAAAHHHYVFHPLDPSKPIAMEVLR